MKISGTVQGEYASYYPDFSYKKPINMDLNVHSVDPDRLNFMNEFPRWTKIYPPNINYVNLADYEIVVGPVNYNGLSYILLTMVPNEYTYAKTKREVCGFWASNANLHRKQYVDYIMKLAFGDYKAIQP